MKILLDTHILIWAAAGTLPETARSYITDANNTLLFSPASIWEIVIKKGLNRPDFHLDPAALYRGCLDNGYFELAISGGHVLAVGSLPPIQLNPAGGLRVGRRRRAGGNSRARDRSGKPAESASALSRTWSG